MNEAPSVAELEVTLGALLPSGVGMAVWSEVLGVDPLGPNEGLAVARAVPKRKQEFERGRTTAREALRRSGFRGRRPEGSSTHAENRRPQGRTRVSSLEDWEIPVGSSREPVWPQGFTGSITHCDGLVAAVATPVHVVRGIGLDGEPDRPLPTDIVPQVLTPEERAETGVDGIVRFSAKEAVHKALFPITRVWLDFLDVTLELDAAAGTFQARPAVEAQTLVSEIHEISGRYVRAGGLVVAAAWL